MVRSARLSGKGFRYRVDRYAPSAIEAALVRIWRDNLPLHGSPAQKFLRLYRDAPEPPDTVFTLSFITAAAEPQIVGTAGIVLRRFWVVTDEVPAALLIDLAVDEQHRSLFPALQLVRAVRSYALDRYALIYGLPNDQAAGVLQRAGYRDLGPMVRYARVLKYARYAQQAAQSSRFPRVAAAALRIPSLMRTVGAIADAPHRIVDAAMAMRARRRYRLHWIDRPDDRFDGLWVRARHEYRVIGSRTLSYLRWRSPPSDDCRIATLVDRRSTELKAYALIQEEQGTAHLRDLFGHVDDLPALLDLLLVDLRRQGLSSASIRFLGNRRIVKTIASRSFRPRDQARRVLVTEGASGAQHATELADIDCWHLTDLDEDE